MLILRPHPRPSEAETLALGAQKFWFDHTFRAILRHIEAWEPPAPISSQLGSSPILSTLQGGSAKTDGSRLT